MGFPRQRTLAPHPGRAPPASPAKPIRDGTDAGGRPLRQARCGAPVTFRFVDHTAELQLELEAPAREALFAEAVAALAHLLAERAAPAPPPGVSPPAESLRQVTAAARDDPALLAAWLDELLFVAESEQLAPRGVVQLDVGAGEVRGLVSFVAAAGTQPVKGVTYHDLLLERSQDGGWRGRVVLDV